MRLKNQKSLLLIWMGRETRQWSGSATSPSLPLSPSPISGRRGLLGGRGRMGNHQLRVSCLIPRLSVDLAMWAVCINSKYTHNDMSTDWSRAFKCCVGCRAVCTFLVRCGVAEREGEVTTSCGVAVQVLGFVHSEEAADERTASPAPALCRPITRTRELSSDQTTPRGVACDWAGSDRRSRLVRLTSKVGRAGEDGQDASGGIWWSPTLNAPGNRVRIARVVSNALGNECPRNISRSSGFRQLASLKKGSPAPLQETEVHRYSGGPEMSSSHEWATLPHRLLPSPQHDLPHASALGLSRWPSLCTALPRLHSFSRPPPSTAAANQWVFAPTESANWRHECRMCHSLSA